MAFSTVGVCAGDAVIAVGAAFSAMGLLLGSILLTEAVLPLANLAWFAQMGICAATVFLCPCGAAATALQPSPPWALALGLRVATVGQLDTVSLLILAGWALVAAWAAKKTFRFT